LFLFGAGFDYFKVTADQTALQEKFTSIYVLKMNIFYRYTKIHKNNVVKKSQSSESCLQFQ